MEPKYLNPFVNKSSIILNKNNFDKNKYIIITEGLIDADAVGQQGTSILGKELSLEFVDIIKQYTDVGIIVVMDNDEDGIKKLYDYTKKYNTLKYFLMPKNYYVKDLNDLVTQNIINRDNIYNFILENSFNSIKARTKIVFENRVKNKSEGG
jgi:5S rRNA maturation endonuclease (ribonuclease M5)